MTPLLTVAPNKPRFGEPCNGCGYCCAAEVCEVGRAVCGPEVVAPCPLMEFDEAGSHFRCGAVRAADALDPFMGLFLRLKMGIGRGCDADDADVADGMAGPRPSN